MAGGYVAAAGALLVHANNIADAIQPLTGGKRPAVAGIPDPKLDDLAVWLEFNGRSDKEGFASDTDVNRMPINIAASTPYGFQRDNATFAFEVLDIFNEELVDEFDEIDALRFTRVLGIGVSPGELSHGKSALVFRASLSVPIYTRVRP